MLQRTLADIPADARQEAVSGMGIKIALGSYRMFFVHGNEDYYHRLSTPEEEAAREARIRERNAAAKDKMNKFVNSAQQDVVMA